MFPVGASTSGVRRLQRRRPPSPPSRRKTKRGLREEGIMRRKRKEKPILQVLLIASLAINTTLSFVVLANRNRMVQATERKESVAAPAVITLEGATVESKVPTAANPVSQPSAIGCQENSGTRGNGETICSCKDGESVEGKRRNLFFSDAYSLPASAGYGSCHQKRWCENSYPARNPGPRGGHQPGR